MADESTAKLAGTKSAESSGGWAEFLTELLKSFLILRDVFGYAFPGVIFLGIGIFSRQIDAQKLKTAYQTYPLPVWAAASLTIVVCYAIGHILAAIAYLPWGWKLPKINITGEHKPGEPDKSPTDVTPKILDARLQYPALLIESDRREIMAMFRGSTGMGLVLGVVLFYWCRGLPYEWMFVIGGVALLFPFYFGTKKHLRDVKAATEEAAAMSDARAKAIATPVTGLTDAGKAVADALKVWLGTLFK